MHMRLLNDILILMSRYSVYKFGGASIATAERIKAMAEIVCQCPNSLIVVVSALGKSTNELEKIVECSVNGEAELYNKLVDTFILKHIEIARDLSLSGDIFTLLSHELYNKAGCIDEYDAHYDAIVCYGELFSTTLINSYLCSLNADSALLDARKVVITDSKHRDASVNIELSRVYFDKENLTSNITITQGFIGSTVDGKVTTLGREGSDYSAAIFSVISKTPSITIWKDVEGVLNADPRIYTNAILIPHLSYNDAVELSYSGAQVIHPKTIRPLQNIGATLYVKSFLNPEGAGTTIDGCYSTIDIPIITIKNEQILLTIAPHNFSFVLEESLAHIFSVVNSHRQKINMIQSSAVSISIAIDNSRYFDDMITELRNHYKVTYNKDLELITIRGERDRVEEQKGEIYLLQHSRRMTKILRATI